MEFMPLNVVGKCVVGDEELFANMQWAISRELPEVSKKEDAREGVIAIVGSGPSVKGQLETIRKMQQAGTPIVAVKDAHDWLIENGVVPEYAFAIDPQKHRWDCFKKKHLDVRYMISSQCHPDMFLHLAVHKITIWHPLITKGQTRPGKRMLIGGGTTSGLRAISLFYVLGWRHFALFGFDSCLEGGTKLRVNGDGPKDGDKVSEVRIDPQGETFYCTSAMALQAQQFQNYYEWMPDAQYYPYGHGLIQAMIKKREENGMELQAIMASEKMANHRVSFIHAMDEDQASYRYRAQIPAAYLDYPMNDFTADTLVFSKPQPHELMQMARAKARGAWVVVDFCDDHFDWMHYAEALRMADAVTCNTEVMAERIKELGREAAVIGDPYEYTKLMPHCRGANLLWFGHSVNRDSLARIMPELNGFPLRVVSNMDGAIPWSKETMLREFITADIVVIPATDRYKSNNRTLESIRQGCFVVAEEHPSLTDIPGIWIGDIREGIEWAMQNPQLANDRTLKAQKYVETRYSPQTLTAAWRKAIQRPTISAAEQKNGTDG